jgi:hypothetical protein
VGSVSWTRPHQVLRAFAVLANLAVDVFRINIFGRGLEAITWL